MVKHFYSARAGRLDRIMWMPDAVISVGEKGYARLEIRRPTAATLGRLNGLAARRYGSAPDGRIGGVVYRSPWAYLRALARTQKFMVDSRRRAKKKAKQEAKAKKMGKR